MLSLEGVSPAPRGTLFPTKALFSKNGVVTTLQTVSKPFWIISNTFLAFLYMNLPVVWPLFLYMTASIFFLSIWIAQFHRNFVVKSLCIGTTFKYLLFFLLFLMMSVCVWGRVCSQECSCLWSQRHKILEELGCRRIWGAMCVCTGNRT